MHVESRHNMKDIKHHGTQKGAQQKSLRVYNFLTAIMLSHNMTFFRVFVVHITSRPIPNASTHPNTTQSKGTRDTTIDVAANNNGLKFKENEAPLIDNMFIDDASKAG